MPLGPIFDAEKKNLLAPPPKKSASNFCDLFQFTLSLIFTRPAAIWPFFVVFCFSTHTVHTVNSPNLPPPTQPYTRQCMPFILRKRLSQLRLGCLPIRIESDRYTRPIVHRDLRYCLQPKCKNVANSLDDSLKDVETEFHFLIVCSQYDSLRNILYSKIESPCFATLTNQHKFVYLLTNQSVSKIVAQFIVDAFDERPVKM